MESIGIEKKKCSLVFNPIFSEIVECVYENKNREDILLSVNWGKNIKRSVDRLRPLRHSIFKEFASGKEELGVLGL